MKYLASIILILVALNGCNSGSSSSEEVGSVNNAPQPNVENSSLQPPKPPSL